MKFILTCLYLIITKFCISQDSIKLSLINFPINQKIYINKFNGSSTHIVDSVLISSKNQEKIITYNTLSVLSLRLKGYKNIYIPFIVEKSNIRIIFSIKRNISLDSIYNTEYYKIEGGKENIGLINFRKLDLYWYNKIITYIDQRDKSYLLNDSNIYKKYSDSVKFYNKVRDGKLCDYISMHLSDFAVLDFYYREAGRIYYVDNLKKMFLNLSDDLQSSEIGKRTKNILFPPLKNGDHFIDITQSDVTGKKISLAGNLKKYTLLEFWASWCSPCLEQFQHLKPIYNDFWSKGFSIFAVSVDDDEIRWKETIRINSYLWINVSSLDGKNNQGAISYGVLEYPTNYLINSNGIIIKKNISIDELKNFLKENL